MLHIALFIVGAFERTYMNDVNRFLPVCIDKYIEYNCGKCGRLLLDGNTVILCMKGNTISGVVAAQESDLLCCGVGGCGVRLFGNLDSADLFISSAESSQD